MPPTIIQNHFGYYAAMIWTWAVNFVPHLVTAILILGAGYVFSVWIARTVRNVLTESAKIDPTAQPVITAAIRYGILTLVVVAALGQIGIQTASLLTVLGAAGLAIGLALQGTLTNIAAGAMLLWLRPFQVGDYIEVPANNIAGTVTAVGLFACTLENAEGVFVFTPNGLVWNAALRNHNRNNGRLISFTVRLPVAVNAQDASKALISMVNDDPRVQKNPPPVAFIESYDAANGAVVNCIFRASHGHAGEVQRDIVAVAIRKLQEFGAGAPQQIIRMVPPDPDPSRFIIT